MNRLTLLSPTGDLSHIPLTDPTALARPRSPLRSRVAYAAAHVVPVIWGDNTPGRPAEIDWDSTLEIRRNIYSWGLGVADAMDTAQRNMGLDPAAVRELISRSAQVAREEGGSVVVGVSTDHVEDPVLTVPQIIDAYLEQLHYAEDNEAGAVLMASRHLARVAEGPQDYRRVYDALLRAASRPVVLHWLGTAFDPELEGYFGAPDWRKASETLLQIIEGNPGKVSGIKMSLLDADAEISVRERLPQEVRMYTGDDFNYVRLIGGDSGPSGVRTHSDALLGAFAAFAPLASSAIQALDRDDRAGFDRILEPTEALSRHVFASPTYYYKTGVAFLAWLNGHQPAFQMVSGLHSARSLPLLSRIVELANAACALENPELAAERWTSLLRLNGCAA